VNQKGEVVVSLERRLAIPSSGDRR